MLKAQKFAFAWRSTAWWQNTKASSMNVPANNHTSGTDQRLHETYFPRAQAGGRPFGEWGRGGAEKITTGKGDSTELEGCSRVLGWQHKDRWKKWMRCCDQRFGPGTSGFQSVKLLCHCRLVRHGSGSCGSQFSDWHLGSCVGKIMEENTSECVDEIIRYT